MDFPFERRLFNEFAGVRPAASLKKHSAAGVFFWILWNWWKQRSGGTAGSELTTTDSEDHL